MLVYNTHNATHNAITVQIMMSGHVICHNIVKKKNNNNKKTYCIVKQISENVIFVLFLLQWRAIIHHNLLNPSVKRSKINHEHLIYIHSVIIICENAL